MGDWRSRLDNVKTLRETDPARYIEVKEQLKRLAGNWNSCVVREVKQALLIKGYKYKKMNLYSEIEEPLDPVVFDLGMKFFETIRFDEDWDKAYRILCEIEKLT